ncbi:hypothetical protein [Oceanibacterium hippocampi]|uniref:Lipoprotein n=1 Tax=Oceanibacterium hippocampi TaxID=745714 RepID=A0A1Y5U335_9PROT|nr:hypothetical protein [Oceanibacterium hippocampi]SLN77641.1 hypothetical protein OCH7691_04493 [Oceanibacterium hippocampi]
MTRLALAGLLLALGGCAGAGGYVDAAVGQVQQVNDALIPRQIEALCLYPHSALVRHGARNPLDGAFLAARCGTLNAAGAALPAE